MNSRRLNYLPTQELSLNVLQGAEALDTPTQVCNPATHASVEQPMINMAIQRNLTVQMVAPIFQRKSVVAPQKTQYTERDS